MFAVGSVVAEKYRILDLHAAGGMGRIYRAEQVPLGRIVALKVLTGRYAAQDPQFQKRFLREAATCARLTHPNTVTIHDYGCILGPDGKEHFFIAMEFVVGRTLHQVLKAEGHLPFDRALRIAWNIARSLREAHRLSIVHRDLKPANVIIVPTDEGETVKVLDFGLAKVMREDEAELTQEGKFLGSPKYMAPEQIRPTSVLDGRADIYALGVILYLMVSGKVPFDGSEPMQTLMAHISEPVPPIEQHTGVAVDPMLESFIRKCLAKQPSERYATITEFIAALNEVGEYLERTDNRIRWNIDSHQSMPAISTTPSSTPPARRVSDASGSRSGVVVVSGTLPPATPPLAPEAEIPVDVAVVVSAGAKPGSRRMRVLAIVGAIVAAVVLGLVFGRGRGEPAQPESGPLAPRVPAKVIALPVPAKVAAPPVPAVVTPTLRLESTPEGADVWEAGARLGVTPLTMPLEAGRGRSLEVRLAGFVPAHVEQVPTTTNTVQHVTLVRAPARPDRSPGKQPARPPSPHPEPRPSPDLGIKTTR